MRTMHMVGLAATAAMVGGLAIAAPAQAAFPGENGEIAYLRTTSNPVGATGLASARQLNVIDPDTKQQRALASGLVTAPDGPGAFDRSGDWLAAPEFTPDGRYIAANSYSSAQPDTGLPSLGGLGFVPFLLPFGSDLRILDAQTGAVRCSAPGGLPAMRHQFDAASDQIVFPRAPAASFDFFFTTNVERFDTSCGAGGPGAFATVESQFALSPDGTRKIEGTGYTPTSPPDTLQVKNVDGSGAKPPVSVGGIAFAFDWAPDGSEVVFGFQDDPGTVGSIKALDVETGAIRDILTEAGGVVHFPTFSPDGKKIAYTRTDVDTTLSGELFVVDASRDASNPAAPPPVPVTTLSGDFISADTQPDWGPKRQPDQTPTPTQTPTQTPASIPGAPGAGNQVCGVAPERPKSKKGTPRYTKQGLKIDQNIASAVIIRLETINELLDKGLTADYLCTGGFGPTEFQAGMSFAGGGHQMQGPPGTPDLTFRKRKKNGEIERSRAQLETNEQIGRVLFARAVATYKRVENLTGGNLAAGVTLGDRVVWQGLATNGAQPPSADAPATQLEVGKLPRKIKIQPNARTVRRQQQRGQRSIILANKALDALTAGLTGEHFQDGSIGAARF